MKRRTIAGIVIGAVAAGAIALGAWWFLAQPSGPEATARSYFDALAAGDGEKAMALLSERPADDIDRADALGEAEGRLTQVAVTEIAEKGKGRAEASVTYSLDGAPHDATVTLVETADGWRVGSDALGAVRPQTNLGDHVFVGGAFVPADADTPLLPALYGVKAAPMNILSGTAKTAVTVGGTSDVAVEASVSADAVATAQEQVDLYAQRCAAPAEAVPPRCGIRVPWAADLATLTSIAFRIEKTPQLTLAPDLQTFAATDGVIVATATGTTRDGAEASFTYRADDWALRGTVTLTRDDMKLVVD